VTYDTTFGYYIGPDDARSGKEFEALLFSIILGEHKTFRTKHNSH